MKVKTRRTASTTIVASAIAALSITLAPQAMANSFNHQTAAGGYGYNDGADQFCVVAHPGRSISATLTPDNASRGPSRYVSASNGRSDCASLATAYEDSGYTARVSGTSSVTESVHFYS